MKKEIVIMLAAAGILVGCQERSETDTTVSEPAGAERIMRTNELDSSPSLNTNSLDTNTIQEPSGAATESSSSGSAAQDASRDGAASSQQDTGAKQDDQNQQSGSQPQSGANP